MNHFTAFALLTFGGIFLTGAFIAVLCWKEYGGKKKK